jgi:hypothetical protein
MHWTHPFGDKVSGKSEYKNQSEAFLADLIHRFFDPEILSLDLKVNIQEAKRVPQLLLQFRQQKQSKTTPAFYILDETARPTLSGSIPDPKRPPVP